MLSPAKVMGRFHAFSCDCEVASLLADHPHRYYTVEQLHHGLDGDVVVENRPFVSSSCGTTSAAILPMEGPSSIAVLGPGVECFPGSRVRRVHKSHISRTIAGSSDRL